MKVVISALLLFVFSFALQAGDYEQITLAKPMSLPQLLKDFQEKHAEGFDTDWLSKIMECNSISVAEAKMLPGGFSFRIPDEYLSATAPEEVKAKTRKILAQIKSQPEEQQKIEASKVITNEGGKVEVKETKKTETTVTQSRVEEGVATTDEPVVESSKKDEKQDAAIAALRQEMDEHAQRLTALEAKYSKNVEASAPETSENLDTRIRNWWKSSPLLHKIIFFTVFGVAFLLFLFMLLPWKDSEKRRTPNQVFPDEENDDYRPFRDAKEGEQNSEDETVL